MFLLVQTDGKEDENENENENENEASFLVYMYVRPVHRLIFISFEWKGFFLLRNHFRPAQSPS
jgi:hypothetical protein